MIVVTTTVMDGEVTIFVLPFLLEIEYQIVCRIILLNIIFLGGTNAGFLESMWLVDFMSGKFFDGGKEIRFVSREESGCDKK